MRFAVNSSFYKLTNSKAHQSSRGTTMWRALLSLQKLDGGGWYLCLFGPLLSNVLFSSTIHTVVRQNQGVGYKNHIVIGKNHAVVLRWIKDEYMYMTGSLWVWVRLNGAMKSNRIRPLVTGAHFSKLKNEKIFFCPPTGLSRVNHFRFPADVPHFFICPFPNTSCVQKWTVAFKASLRINELQVWHGNCKEMGE